MPKSIGVLLLVLAVAIGLSAVSLLYSHEVRAEGLFTLYQGENYVERGYPWGFWRCSEDGLCSVVISRLFMGIAFWIVVIVVVIAVVRFVVRLF